ncbi:uncharacterized protein EDB91DRAFT_1086208 [Suillus paluster]|uniref:uncharacterized protein n=1 Tax=Suillus paluster TaxID=48578 RepID=UPI001B88221E|nr:uncharacterized protein EDB91DRAFT_1086208 [Suillus paluster]KAG1728041.1 hypothetical protein EDB91DRAFT_1086208 [Suillus paluster]
MKSVKLLASVDISTNSGPNPLYDDDDDDSLQQFLHYCHLTSNGQNILSELTKLPPQTGRIMEFYGVGAWEYERIEELLGKTGWISKPRTLYRSTSLQSQYNISDVTPDICITITPAEGPTKIILVPFIGECACSEDKDHSIHKLKDTITGHPHAEMAVLGLVCEVQPYNCPKKSSPASNTLHKHNEVLPLDTFITEHFPSCTSITVANHNWCHISSVEFFIWVRGDDETDINLSKQDAEHMAQGSPILIQTLLPNINMDAVIAMLKQGLAKIRDSFVAFSKELNPNIDCAKLEEAIVTFPVRWKDYVIALRNAADVTAWMRYKAWHEGVISDEDSDPPYVPSNAAEASAHQCTKDIIFEWRHYGRGLVGQSSRSIGADADDDWMERRMDGVEVVGKRSGY